MTPKLKAENLVGSYRIILINEDTECGEEILCTLIAKQCALIAVDEIIQQWEVIDTYIADFGGQLNQSLKYWQEVKQEIEIQNT
jgi:hypothetical protein